MQKQLHPSNRYTIGFFGMFSVLLALFSWVPFNSVFAQSQLEQIAYTTCSDAGDFATCEIYVMDANGSNVQRLTNNNVYESAPSWSPDGSRIAFASYLSGSQELYVMNADGSNIRQLTNVPGRLTNDPSWSPDGSRIAFAADNEIYVIDPEGSNLQRLTTNSIEDSAPAWSPDGTRIAFASRRGDGRVQEIYVVNADGSNEQQLTFDYHAATNPDWSPDGTRIAFDSSRYSEVIAYGVALNSAIFVMDIDGSNMQRLTNNGYSNDRNPEWSPDGSRIIFSSNRDATSSDFNFEIYLMDADGSNVERVTNTTERETQPTWWRGNSAFPIDTLSPTTAPVVRVQPTLVQSNASTLLQTGIETYWLGQSSEALIIFNDILESDPTNLVALAYRGTTLRVLEEYDAARDDFDRALQIDPNFALAYAFRGRLNADLDREDEAIQDVERAVELDPTEALVFYNRGRVYEYFDPQNYGQFVPDYEQAIAVDDGSNLNRTVTILTELGDAYLEIDNRDLEKAIEYYTQSLNLNPTEYYTLLYRSGAYYLDEQKHLALDDMAQAMIVRPDDFPQDMDAKSLGNLLLETEFLIQDTDIVAAYELLDDAPTTTQIPAPYYTRFGLLECDDIYLTAPLSGSHEFFGQFGNDIAYVSSAIYYSLSDENAEETYYSLIRRLDRCPGINVTSNVQEIGDDTITFQLTLPYETTSTTFGLATGNRTEQMPATMIVFREGKFVSITIHGNTVLFQDPQTVADELAHIAFNRILRPTWSGGGSTLVPTRAPTISVQPTRVAPTRVAPPESCPNVVPSRVSVGITGVITPGVANRLRQNPTTTSSVLGRMSAGQTFEIIGGPDCAEGYRWWQVRFRGTVGWTAEGDRSSYYIAPTS